MRTTKSWTKEEQQYVRDNYLKMTYDEIAKTLNRTLISVSKWILNHKLGIRKVNRVHIGQKFGRLTVIDRVFDEKIARNKCVCQCSCPKQTILTVEAKSLNNGDYKSCGCYRLKRTKDISGAYFSNIKRGAKKRKLEFDITIRDCQD